MGEGWCLGANFADDPFATCALLPSGTSFLSVSSLLKSYEEVLVRSSGAFLVLLLWQPDKEK